VVAAVAIVLLLLLLRCECADTDRYATPLRHGSETDKYKRIILTGDVPCSRYYHGMAITDCNGEQRLYIFGGKDATNRHQDMYSISVADLLSYYATATKPTQ
jgi:hypothetical protein